MGTNRCISGSKAEEVRMPKTPLEIAFHSCSPSEAVEADIRERADKLERVYDRLTRCRVSVEALHNQHRHGNVYEVHIELLVPGGQLVVSRAPHKPKERYASPDVYVSVRDAFEAAERQLIDYKQQLRGDVKTSAEQNLFQGQVAEIDPAGEFGFILSKEGNQLYFHRHALLDGEWEKLARGVVVHYVEKDGDTGPTAAKVWIGPEHTLD
jgi:cold shock CspA family protein/ribosome-associated translation inhibitor RaiA